MRNNDGSETLQSLSTVVGANVRRLRLQRGISQDELARRFRDAGLDMTRSAVAALERGGRNLTVADFLLVCVALLCAPNELLNGNGHVALSPTSSGRLEDVRRLLAGRNEELKWGAIDRPATRKAKSKPFDVKHLNENMETWERLMPGATWDQAEAAEESAKGEAETRTARALRVPGWQVGAAAFGLWGHSLTAEREQRVKDLLDPSTPTHSARTIRGHVTHQLVGEIRLRLEEVGDGTRSKAR